MKKSTTSKNLYYLLGILLIIVVWTTVSFIYDESSMVFPSIDKVLTKTIEILKSAYLYKCLYSTFKRLVMGFVVSILLAFIFGTIAGLNNKIKHMLYPLMTTLKTIPTASLVFLFLIVAGVKRAPIYIVILVCFPILYEAFCAGYENIDKDINDALSLEKIPLIKEIFKIRLPLAIPHIIVGIASSLGLSFKIEIMAEILTGDTRNGLGSAISYIQKSDPTNMASIFAYSLVAVAISLIFGFIASSLKNKLLD